MSVWLEEWDRTPVAQAHVVPETPTGEMPYDTGFSGSLGEEKPMFSLLEKAWLQHASGSPQVVTMAASNKIVAIATDTPSILRINLNTHEVEEVEIRTGAAEKDLIRRVFLDPTGNHILISMESRDNFYLPSSWRKPKLLSKMKGVMVESVGWNQKNTSEGTTKEILIGTSLGTIHETILESKERAIISFNENKDKFRQVYDLHENMPITGLRVETFPSADGETNKYFIMAATPTRYYQFIGGPTFEATFAEYPSNPSFTELPGDIERSELHFFSKHAGRAQSFAWLTDPGVYHGKLSFGSQGPGESLVSQYELLPYPPSMSVQLSPTSLAMTEFHFILLYEDQFQVVSQLNSQVVYDEALPQGLIPGTPLGVIRDESSGSVWMYTEKCIWQVIVHDEDRHVWKQLLGKRQFDAALSYCKNLSQRDCVLTAEAEHHFSQEAYEKSAAIFAKTQKSFEEITLKFIRKNQRDALKSFLVHKLDNVRNQDATQLTVICTWLTEIYMDKMNSLKGTNDTAYKATSEEFQSFLRDNKQSLNPATTFQIMSSHGREDELLYYATLMNDHERVIAHHVQHGNYATALDILSKQSDQELYYKFSPFLMSAVPVETVNCWIGAPFLDPKRLIPALMRFSVANLPRGETRNQAIRYLQHCVHKLGNEDPAVHNYLISLYAKQSDESDLLKCLATDRTNQFFDLEYALRLCSKEKKYRACVHIYGMMGLYEEAVDLALKVDYELAKVNADMADDDEHRKKLWLRIARHVVEEKKDIKAAIAFLDECELLKIEDILPFFPDFVLIDDFKDAICSSLEEYNQRIDELKMEMDEATRNADLIRLDIGELRNRYGVVDGSQKCCLCQNPILMSPFHLFPCNHVFHVDCLMKYIVNNAAPARRNHILELKKRIAAEEKAGALAPKKAQVPPEGESVHALNTLVPESEKAKQEIDDILAAECIFCGDMMIRSIDVPLVTEDDASALETWSVS